jgi:anti-sigma28 factor (negative regulator of flagellin synthesis)
MLKIKKAIRNRTLKVKKNKVTNKLINLFFLLIVGT